MKVMKFGGTSVGTPQRMKEVTNLVTKSGEPVFAISTRRILMAPTRSSTAWSRNMPSMSKSYMLRRK